MKTVISMLAVVYAKAWPGCRWSMSITSLMKKQMLCIPLVLDVIHRKFHALSLCLAQKIQQLSSFVVFHDIEGLDRTVEEKEIRNLRSPFCRTRSKKWTEL